MLVFDRFERRRPTGGRRQRRRHLVRERLARAGVLVGHVGHVGERQREGLAHGRLPAPPEIELNVWTLSVTDGSGNAIPNAAPVMVPWMPDHGHGPSVQPTTTAMGDGKTFKVTDIDLFMAGVWRLTISATPTTAIPDQVVYFFCIEG